MKFINFLNYQKESIQKTIHNFATNVNISQHNRCYIIDRLHEINDLCDKLVDELENNYGTNVNSLIIDESENNILLWINVNLKLATSVILKMYEYCSVANEEQINKQIDDFFDVLAETVDAFARQLACYREHRTVDYSIDVSQFLAGFDPHTGDSGHGHGSYNS